MPACWRRPSVTQCPRRSRARLVAKGGPEEYRDAEMFAAVENVLRRAVDSRDRDAVLLPELLGDDVDWRLSTELSFSSHRTVIGPAIVFLKRRLILPLTRWLYEYNVENFERQQRVNKILFACVDETLAHLQVESRNKVIKTSRVIALLDDSVGKVTKSLNDLRGTLAAADEILSGVLR